MIEIHSLSVAFDDVVALRDVCLSVQAGEVVLLGGPSGCGKSTLLRAVSGIIPHVSAARLSGDITIGGRRIGDVALDGLAQEVGFVFQNPSAQLFHLTVSEEVAFGPRNAGASGADVAQRVRWALEVTGLGTRAERDVRTLSGGERQRVAIASVLATRPSVLALDEPMASLDVSGTQRLIEVLTDLIRAQGTTVLIAEHRLREAASAAGRTVLLDDGRVVADGLTEAVLSDRAHLRRLGLRRPALTPQAAWESLIVQGRPAAGATVVRVQGVSVVYGQHAVLEEVDLSLCEGECVALVGDNGAGKSTVARLIAGMERPSRGRVTWPSGALEPGRGVGILLQEPRLQLFCESVRDEVAFGPMNTGLPVDAIDMWLAAADMTTCADRPLHTLSSGQLHRTALAAVLALRPRVLVLDEPTVGQDWAHLERLMDLVDHLRREGTAVLLISHDYKLIHRHATRIVLLRNGRVAAEGVPADAGTEGEDR
jgi:energy-coupling factor transport system ATP-binding protein